MFLHALNVRDQLLTMSSHAAAPIGNGSLAPADSSGAWVPPDPVPLQAFVAGHTLRRAHTVFEAGMNPFVKCAMRAAFPTDETDPADPYVAALAVAATEETAEALRIQDADLPDAREQLADTITAKAEAAGSSKGMKLLMRAANKAVAKSEDRVRELEDRLWALDRDTAAAEAARMRADELPAAQSASAASAAAASPTQRGAEDSDESWQDGGSNLEARRPRAPPGQRRGRRGDFTRAVRHCGHRGRCEGGSGLS